MDRIFALISRLAFHHFAGVEEPFKGMARVLKHGGKLVMIDMVAGDEALRDEVDRIERLRDPSHVRDLTLSEMRNLYMANSISLKTQEQTDIPVSLEAWMELTKPDGETRKEIHTIMQADINGTSITGFAPYNRDGKIYFNQHWIMNIGLKKY